MSGYQGRGGGGGYRGDRGGGGFRGDRGGGGYRGDRGGGGRGGGRGGARAPAPVKVFQDANATGVPDPDVQKIENAWTAKSKISADALVAAMAKLSVKTEFPQRPGFGVLGKKISVYANYFKVSVPKTLTLTRYSVEISGEKEAKGKKIKRIFELLLELPDFAGVATDWKSMIISPQKLPIEDDIVLSIPYRGDGEEEARESAISKPYQVRVTAPISLSVSDLVKYLSSTDPTAQFNQKLEVIQVLNSVFGTYAGGHSQVAALGGNRYYSTDHSNANAMNIVPLGGYLEILRGYFQSLRPATGNLLLNVNVTYGVFLQPGSLANAFLSLGTGDRRGLSKKLKNKRVAITHLPQKKYRGENVHRIKTICGLAIPGDGRGDENPPQITTVGAGPKDVKFWLNAEVTDAKPAAKGKKAKPSALPGNAYISVLDYFKKKYPTIALDNKWPVVNVGTPEHPMYLPAEVCEIIAGQPFVRKLDPSQTTKMINFACRKPFENAGSIVGDGKAILGLNAASKSLSLKLGLACSASLITVEARVLPPPAIRYKGSNQRDKVITPYNGTWNMADTRFHTARPMGLWTYVLFLSSSRQFRHQDENYKRAIEANVIKYKDFLQNAGIKSNEFKAPPPWCIIEVEDGMHEANDAKTTDVFRQLHQLKPKPNFILCILPSKATQLYNSIKTVADTKAGLHTQCCFESMLLKDQRQDQYFGNLSLKVNLKMGGINHTLDAPKLGVISEGKTMVVGLDVTHPSPGSKEEAPSIAGIVASTDKLLSQWPADIRIQERRKEMVTDLKDMMLGRLKVWQRFNGGKFPENIIMYRDGVSEGQYQIVLDTELPSIRMACREVYTPKTMPKISIIVCGKRHHTRFYPNSEATADRTSNCAAGTVVDRGITEVANWDFFLQPHACLQGTARPCHYFVILDEVFRGRRVSAPHQTHADALEDLTNNMCHLFGRATKAVSLCPPAYYADLLCTRARCYLSRQFDPNDTPAGRMTPMTDTSSQTGSVQPDEVAIAPTLRDTMFYL